MIEMIDKETREMMIYNKTRETMIDDEKTEIDDQTKETMTNEEKTEMID